MDRARRRLQPSPLRLLAILWVLGPARAGGATEIARVAVAWNPLGSSGSVRSMSVSAPWRFQTPILESGQDAAVRFAEGRLFVLSQKDGTVSVVDPASWSVERSIPLGAESRPVDIAVIDPRLAYATRAKATRLLRLDPATGAAEEAADLSAHADADGIPDLGTMAIHEGRLFVQIRRFNVQAPGMMAAPAYLAVVDAATGEEIDTDPGKPGLQAIELQGTSPKHKMQVLPQSRRLFVSATGGSHDAGGLEVIDPARIFRPPRPPRGLKNSG
jgi:YVTN family beta-propeller protein